VGNICPAGHEKVKAKCSLLIHPNYSGTSPAKAFQEFNPKINRSFGRRRAGLEENIKRHSKLYYLNT
jgi:hypothetical protein